MADRDGDRARTAGLGVDFRSSEGVRLAVGVGVRPVQGQKPEDEERQMQHRHFLVDSATGGVAYGLSP